MFSVLVPESKEPTERNGSLFVNIELTDYVISQTMETLHFYDTKNPGKAADSIHSLRKIGFYYDNCYVQCKNCQLSRNEFLLGDGGCSFFVFEVDTERKEFGREIKWTKLRTESVLHSYGQQMCVNGCNYDEKKKNLRKKKIAFSGHFSAEVNIWDLSKKKWLKGMEYDVNDFCYVYETNLMGISLRGKGVTVYDFEALKEVYNFEPISKSSIYIYRSFVGKGMDYDRSRQIIFCGYDGGAKALSIRDKKVIFEMENEDTVESIKGINENIFLLGDEEGFIQKRDIRMHEKTLLKKKIHDSQVRRILNNSNGIKDTIVTCSDDKTIRFLYLETFKQSKMITESDEQYGIFIFNPTDRSERMKLMLQDLNERIDYLVEEFCKEREIYLLNLRVNKKDFRLPVSFFLT